MQRIESSSRGPEPVTYRELAADIYDTQTPTRSQRESVARACRRLASEGVVEVRLVNRQVERKLERAMGHAGEWRFDWRKERVRVNEGAVTVPRPNRRRG
jgi:hypothetical protein